jgi:hypothetical protein
VEQIDEVVLPRADLRQAADFVGGAGEVFEQINRELAAEDDVPQALVAAEFVDF